MIVKPDPWLAVLRRNEEGWWASAKLTARVLFYGPSSLWWMIKDGLGMLVAGVIVVVVNLVTWTSILITQVAAGLAGHLSEDPTVIRPKKD